MHSKSRFRRRASGRSPLATVAAYGPDNTIATKLVVSVFARSGESFGTTRSWTTQGADIRHDRDTATEVTAFLNKHGVRESITPDTIIGCPHEEGIDYPLGRTCPRCPFWAGIDRFTHEPVTPPVPTMSPEEVVAALSVVRADHPREALSSADGHRTALVEPMLDALRRGIADPSGTSAGEGTLFCYALYLLATWREPRAYPYVVRWLSLPDEEPFSIAGDVVTQDGGRILAAVCDGDLTPVQELVTNRHANEYSRGEAVRALALLGAWAEVPLADVIARFQWLAADGLEREPSHVWASLAGACVDIEAAPVFPAIRRAFEDGLIDRNYMTPAELDEAEASPSGHALEQTRERYPPYDDIAGATSWWGCFERAPAGDGGTEPYRAPAKVGRNAPCPCGSGLKYKKCCGGNVVH